MADDLGLVPGAAPLKQGWTQSVPGETPPPPGGIGTPGIAPSPQGGYTGIFPLWLHNLLQKIVGGPAVSRALEPSVAPKDTPLAPLLAPSPGTQAAAAGGLKGLGFPSLGDVGGSIADRLGLPKGGIDWQSTGVYLALFLLFLLGASSLLAAAKEKR